MKINYSLPNYSKFLLYADIGVRHGARHISLAIKGGNFGLSAQERISHLALGILKIIPVIGHIITIWDMKRNPILIKTLDIQSEDPKEQGIEHGRAFKKEIQSLYAFILTNLKKEHPNILSNAKKYERSIPKHLIEEMKGLAEGAEVSYDDVLIIHTFLDLYPGLFGCSAVARTVGRVKEERIAIANHAERNSDEEEDQESVGRVNGLLSSQSDSPQEILQTANTDETIQSIVFDPAQGTIQIAAGERDAAYHRMDSHQVFEKKEKASIQLMRNLDWPWYSLGQNTLLLTRKVKGKKIATVTFPGYLGALSGMNEDGLSLACCSRGDISNRRGIPNPLLFSEILRECSTINDAHLYFNRHQHGSSINVIISDPQNARSFELNDGRNYSVTRNIRA